MTTRKHKDTHPHHSPDRDDPPPAQEEPIMWTATTRRVLKTNAGAAIDAVESVPDDLPPREAAQLDLAQNVAKMIVASDAIGGPAVHVHMAGHANPDAQPKGGDASDSVSVTVQQAEFADDEPVPSPK